MLLSGSTRRVLSTSAVRGLSMRGGGGGMGVVWCAGDDEVHIRDRRGGELDREGDLRGGDRADPEEPRAVGGGAEAGPVPERGPGYDVAVPARGGVRDAGRVRDGPGPGSLRAFHRHRADAQFEHHGGSGVHAVAGGGAPGGASGGYDPDGAARDERDQGFHAAGAGAGRGAGGGGGYGGGHRGPAVPGGDTPDADGGGARQYVLRARDASAVHRGDGGAEDEADAALG